MFYVAGFLLSSSRSQAKMTISSLKCLILADPKYQSRDASGGLTPPKPRGSAQTLNWSPVARAPFAFALAGTSNSSCLFA
jgi:hypothetical protein